MQKLGFLAGVVIGVLVGIVLAVTAAAAIDEAYRSTRKRLYVTRARPVEVSPVPGWPHELSVGFVGDYEYDPRRWPPLGLW
jgi:hypothetical protein